MLTRIGLCATLTCISGCVTSIEDDVIVANAPAEDDEYFEQLQKASKNRKVFKDFEKRYEVTATYFSPEFRAALNERSRRVFMRELDPLKQGSGQATFLISIYGPNTANLELDNEAHWTIQLQGSMSQSMSPLKVDRVMDKEHLRAFFDDVNDWTQEYLVIFDTPAVNPNSPDLVEKTSLNLIFANADAKISLTW